MDSFPAARVFSVFLLSDFLNSQRPNVWWRKSRQFRQIYLFTLDSTQEIYIPSESQETSLQTYTHVFSLEVKMVEILTDLNLEMKMR